MKTRLKYKIEARAHKLSRIYRKFEISEWDSDSIALPLSGNAIKELNKAVALIEETQQLISEEHTKDPLKTQRKALLQESSSEIQECIASFKAKSETDESYILKEEDRKIIRAAINKSIQALHF